MMAKAMMARPLAARNVQVGFKFILRKLATASNEPYNHWVAPHSMHCIGNGGHFVRRSGCSGTQSSAYYVALTVCLSEIISSIAGPTGIVTTVRFNLLTDEVRLKSLHAPRCRTCARLKQRHRDAADGQLRRRVILHPLEGRVKLTVGKWK